MAGALDGLLVVSLEQAVAAPFCTQRLADAGARVIKIEREGGETARHYDAAVQGTSAYFVWLNRGKESICLNLKDPEDLAVMHRMLAKADVFVSNLAPGSVTRMGLGGAELRRDNPGLITCMISGYGQSGAAAKKKAYDFLIQAESGLCSVTGSAESPARVGLSLTDLSTGLTAFSAILRALIQRGRTGRGIDFEISMFDVLADWMNMPLLAHRYMGGAPARSGLKHSFIAPYGAFECRDRAQVLISVQSNREFAALCSQVLQRPELPEDPRFSENPERYAHRDALDAIVADCFAQFTAAEMVDKLDAAQIANAQLNSVADLSDHPFLRNSVAQIGDCDVSLAALPVTSHAGPGQKVPNLGAQTVALRAEFKA